MKFGPFHGENNRLPLHALAVSERGQPAGSFLSSSKNILIGDTGRIEARDGFTRGLATTTGRSLFSGAGKMLYADGTALKKVTFSPLSSATVDTVAANRIAYVENNGEIYYSDGAKLACLESGDTVRPVGVPVPDTPTGEAIAGALVAASYQATLTYFVGVEEGGAALALSVDLGAASGLRLALPAAPAGVTAVGVYLSGPNGTMPLLADVVSPATTTIDLTEAPAGRALQTQFREPMPAGDLLAFHDSRLLVAVDNMLIYSDPYHYAMRAPVKNYIPFPATISVLQPCINGIYVAADKTYWLTGIGTDEMAMPQILPYGAVRFSGGKVPNEEKVFWLSNRGVVIGDRQGQVANLQEAAMKLDLSGDGASIYMEGYNRIIATHG